MPLGKYGLVLLSNFIKCCPNLRQLNICVSRRRSETSYRQDNLVCIELWRVGMKEHYICKFCGINERDQFTRRCYYECRKCRAARSKDVHFERHTEALKNQTLARIYWKLPL